MRRPVHEHVHSVLVPLVLLQTPLKIDDAYLKLIAQFRGTALADPTGATYSRVRIRVERRYSPFFPKPADSALIDGWLAPDRQSVVLWDGQRYPVLAVAGKGDLDLARKAILSVDQPSRANFVPGTQKPLSAESVTWSMSNPVAPAIWYLAGEKQAADQLYARIKDQNYALATDPFDQRFRTWLADRLRMRFFEPYHRARYEEALGHLLVEQTIPQPLSHDREVGRQDKVEDLIAEVRRRIAKPPAKPSFDSVQDIVQSLEEVQSFPNWSPNFDPIFEAAAKRGPEIIPAMITVLKQDKRLTRAEYPSRNFPDCSIAPVSLAASYVLQENWPEFIYYEFEKRTESELQAAWMRHKNLPRPDRYVDMMEDPNMSSTRVGQILRALLSPASWHPKRYAIEARLAAPRLRGRIRAAFLPRIDKAIADSEKNKDPRLLEAALRLAGTAAQWDYEMAPDQCRLLARTAVDRLKQSENRSLIDALAPVLVAGMSANDHEILEVYGRLCSFENQPENWRSVIAPARQCPNVEFAQTRARGFLSQIHRILRGDQGTAMAMRFLNGLFRSSLTEWIDYPPFRELLLRALENEDHIIVEDGPNYNARLDMGELTFTLKNGPDLLRLRVDDFTAWNLTQKLKTNIPFDLLAKDKTRAKARESIRQWLRLPLK